MDRYKKILSRLSCVPFSEIETLSEAHLFRAAFVVEAVQVKVSSKNQKKFAIAQISDGLERFELPIWSEMFEEKAALLKENQLLYAILQTEKKEGSIQLSCRYLDDLTTIDETKAKACEDAYDRLKAIAKAPEPKWKSAAKEKTGEKEEVIKIQLKLDADKIRFSQILALKEHFRANPGKSTLDLMFYSEGRSVGSLLINAEWGVKADKSFLEKLKALTEIYSIP